VRCHTQAASTGSIWSGLPAAAAVIADPIRCQSVAASPEISPEAMSLPVSPCSPTSHSD
jgi:hypothetical protein